MITKDEYYILKGHYKTMRSRNENIAVKSDKDDSKGKGTQHGA